jgi:SNF2 family DNA or RNA helicase
MDRPLHVVMPGDIPRTSGVVIIFYDAAVKHLALLMSVQWDVLIIDEAHYLKSRYVVSKNTSGYRTRAIYGSGKRYAGLITKATRTWRLTGTPALNHAGELWTHVRSAGLTDMPYQDWLYFFCEGFDSEHGFRFTKHRHTEELQKILEPFMLRRAKAEVQPNLKEPMFETITVPRSDAALAPEFLQLIPQLDQAGAQLQEALNSGSPEDQLATLESMASSLASLRRYTLMAKLPAIAEQIEADLTTNQIPKLTVFGIHKIGMKWLAEKLSRFNPLTITGDTPAEKRQPNIDRFQSDPTVRLILGNIAAMGTGVDGLQNVCDEAIFCEQDWVPSSNAQAIMRLCRIGQKNPVRARIFSLYGSVDEHVQDTLTKKMIELAKIL